MAHNHRAPVGRDRLRLPRPVRGAPGDRGRFGEALDRLAGLFSSQPFAAGDIVFKAGDRDGRFYVLVRGTVELLADAEPPDLYTLHGYNISKTIVQPCDDGRVQKWNADPRLDAPPLQDIGER